MKIKIESRDKSWWNGYKEDGTLFHFRISNEWKEKLLNSFDKQIFIEIPDSNFISLKSGELQLGRPQGSKNFRTKLREIGI